MILEVSTRENKELEDFFEESIADIGKFFKLNWVQNKPKLFVLNDRKTINELKGQKTEDWIVGFTRCNDVYVLAFDKFGTESKQKYSREQYRATLKHELTHAFTRLIKSKVALRKYTMKPIWLTEGIAIFLSGQLQFRKTPPKGYNFKEFLNFHDEGGQGVYKESGFAVKYLIEEFGGDKMLTLIKKSAETEKEEDFKKLFKEICGFELDYKNFKV